MAIQKESLIDHYLIKVSKFFAMNLTEERE